MKNYFWIILIFIFPLPYSYSQKITNSVSISPGAINGVWIEKKGKNLVVYGEPNDQKTKADLVLFTHFRRDVIWAGRNLVQNGAFAVVPAEEKAYFANVDSIWKEFTLTRYHDYSNQTTKIGSIPLKVYCFVHGGEILNWQGIDVKVLSTPGYTRGSVSYIMDIDSKRFAFVGDLIYGDGQILDLYSFQDSLGLINGYMGYASRLGQLITSLQLIANQKPDFIIPARGPVISNPDSSIQKLIQKIRSLYQNYLAISSHRWHYQDRFHKLSDHVLGSSTHVDLMPYSTVIQNNPLSWYKHIGTSYLVLAKDSSSFLIDCGFQTVFKEILKMKQSGQLKSLDGIFITHYHDDHTDLLNDVVKEFKCPIYVTKELKDILENPAAYRGPCLTTSGPVTNLTIVPDGQKMSWKEFTLTFRFFPGQTLYHDAVLFHKNNGESIFFIGDSFTPAGIDDYCLLNRNLLRPGTGYFYCLEILKKLPESVLLAKASVDPLFAFSHQQLDFMTNILSERTNILKDLFPWDDINYGIDEQWIRIYPYGQKVIPGQTKDFSVKIYNHSSITKTFFIEPNIPEGFDVEPKISSMQIEPQQEGELIFKLKVSKKIVSDVSLLTIKVKFDNWDLHEWTEGLIELNKGISDSISQLRQ